MSCARQGGSTPAACPPRPVIHGPTRPCLASQPGWFHQRTEETQNPRRAGKGGFAIYVSAVLCSRHCAMSVGCSVMKKKLWTVSSTSLAPWGDWRFMRSSNTECPGPRGGRRIGDRAEPGALGQLTLPCKGIGQVDRVGALCGTLF